MQLKTLSNLNRFKRVHISFLRSFSTLPDSGHLDKKKIHASIATLEHDKKKTGAQGNLRFFEKMREHKNIVDKDNIPIVVSNRIKLKKFLYDLDPKTEGNYLMDNFTRWLGDYSSEKPSCLQKYFSDKEYDLAPVCKNFIQFCFENKIILDPIKTLSSFDEHNKLSDIAIKQNLEKLAPKEELNILGFGLDEGHYEKTLASFLIDRNLAKTVTIHGFDPYASKSPGIIYLTPQQLTSGKIPHFDLIIARWVLHHVELQQRWGNFITCMNNCSPEAMTLVVEHGFLGQGYSLLDKKLYHLLNAIFDIVANIGLRPRYFTNNPKELGADFFISYLEPDDFSNIQNRVILNTSQETYDVGPEFPNQTINCWRVSS